MKTVAHLVFLPVSDDADQEPGFNYSSNFKSSHEGGKRI